MKQHEAWLQKSQNDLDAAKILFSAENPVFDTAIYHTQQCGEKALKAFLAYRNAPLQKTHDLEALLDKCCEYDESFSDLYDYAVTLSPYNTMFRYPGPVLVPDEEDVKSAIESAEKIFNLVKEKINQQNLAGTSTRSSKLEK